ncbi:MAG TPA: SIR2 family protein [Dehalococcoidia bacterium]|nr:SIR2 family protein [Dehalococcoidia bacterium]
MLDLVERVAALEVADTGSDPEAWYVEKFGKPPRYSELLGQLGATAAARSTILRRYFEATEEEREQGRKVPQDGHVAIAELVQRGYVKVIITTNFDRLLEQALSAAGVTPTVISTVDALKGALPLHLSPCTIVKVHGDYLDTRIRNTTDELESYERPLEQLLDRIFGEYGLVVCGWSGDHDRAMRRALERTSNRRFTTYWTTLGHQSELAQGLISLRGAELIEIDGSDVFFRDLANKVASLEALAQPHPLSAAAAVAELKTYLPEERHSVRLHELVMNEASSVAAKWAEYLPDWSGSPKFDDLAELVHQIDGAMETSAQLFATGGYWWRPEIDVWGKAIERVARAAFVPPRHRGHWYPDYQYLSLYPALVLLFAGCLGAIARVNYSAIRMFLHTDVPDDDGKRPALRSLIPVYVLTEGIARKVCPHPDPNLHYLAPQSEHLNRRLRSTLADLIPEDQEYDALFNRLEYLLVLAHIDDRLQTGESTWAPVGRFNFARDALEQISAEVDRAGDAWAPFTAGLFGGSAERFKAARERYEADLHSSSGGYRFES